MGNGRALLRCEDVKSGGEGMWWALAAMRPSLQAAAACEQAAACGACPPDEAAPRQPRRTAATESKAREADASAPALVWKERLRPDTVDQMEAEQDRPREILPGLGLDPAGYFPPTTPGWATTADSG